MELRLTWGRIALALVFVLAASVGDAAEAARPSFDCALAKSVAEKMICADPGLAAADAAIAANYAAALKRLDAPARKALAQDQQDFVSYRDRIAGFDQGVPKDKQNFPIDEFMRDRAAFLASIEKPEAGFVGSWKNVQGVVTIKSAGSGQARNRGRYCQSVDGRERMQCGRRGESADKTWSWSTRTATKSRPVSSTASTGSAMRSKPRRPARRRATKVSRRRAAPMVT